MERQHLIQRIREHAEASGLSPATITVRAVNNSRLYARLVAGGDCTTEIAAKVISYLDSNPPTKTPEGAHA